MRSIKVNARCGAHEVEEGAHLQRMMIMKHTTPHHHHHHHHHHLLLTLTAPLLLLSPLPFRDHAIQFPTNSPWNSQDLPITAAFGNHHHYHCLHYHYYYHYPCDNHLEDGLRCGSGYSGEWDVVLKP